MGSPPKEEQPDNARTGNARSGDDGSGGGAASRAARTDADQVTAATARTDLPETDQAFLDEVFDKALVAVQGGGEGLSGQELARLLEGREHLRSHVADVFVLARRVAVQQPVDRPVVAGYEILEELGRGGMGTVYLARQEGLQRLVALKMPPESAWLSPKTRQRFLSEARALARVHHAHVVAVHEVMERERLCAYAMEWIDGPSASQVIEQLERLDHTPTMSDVETVFGHPLDAGSSNGSGSGSRRSSGRGPGVGARGASARAARAASRGSSRELVTFWCRTVSRVARALDAVHQAGLLHRDVKPSNILLRRDGSPVLTDFGLARDEEGGGTGTLTGEFVGTPAFAAPEQLRGLHDRVDPRTDVYALGATLYQMLSLCLPYSGRSPGEILRRMEEGFQVPLSKVAPGLPGDVATVVGKAMDPEPVRRYPTAGAVADDLDRLLAGHPILARPPSALYSFGKLVERHKGAFAMLGLLFLSLIAFGVVMVVLNVRIADQRDEIGRQRDEISGQKSELEVQRDEIARQRDEVDEERQRAQEAEVVAENEARNAWQEMNKALAVTGFLRTTLSGAKPTRPGSPAVTFEDALERACRIMDREFEDTSLHEPEIEAAVREAMADSWWKLGRHHEAERHLMRALDLYHELHGKQSEALARAYVILGQLRSDAGELRAAEQAFQTALDMRQELLGDGDLQTLAAMGYVGEAMRGQGKREAAAVMAQALDMRRSIFDLDQGRTIYSLHDLGRLHLARGELREAEHALLEAWALARELGWENLVSASVMRDIGVLNLRAGRPEDAVRWHRDAHKHRAVSRPTPDAMAARLRCDVADALLRCDDLVRSQMWVDKALDVLEAPPSDPLERVAQGSGLRAAELGRAQAIRSGIALRQGRPKLAWEYACRAQESWSRLEDTLPVDASHLEAGALACEVLLEIGDHQGALVWAGIVALFADTLQLDDAAGVARGLDTMAAAFARHDLASSAAGVLHDAWELQRDLYGGDDPRSRRAEARLASIGSGLAVKTVPADASSR